MQLAGFEHEVRVVCGTDEKEGYDARHRPLIRKSDNFYL